MTKRKSQKRQNLIFERLMAMIATVNLCLVLFDLSYVPWRDFYLRNLPQITQTVPGHWYSRKPPQNRCHWALAQNARRQYSGCC